MIALTSLPRRSASLVSVLLVLFGLMNSGCGSHPVTGTTIVSQLKLTADSTSVNAGTTTQLHATSTDSNNKSTDVTTSVNWSSSTPTVAAVSPSGMLTGLAAGSTTIAASMNGVSATMPTTIGAPAVTGLTISPSSVTMFTNGKQTFTALASYANNTTGDATNAAQWSITPATVATMGAGGVVTAIAPGTFTVTATAGTQKATATGSVIAAPLESIVVTPSTVTMGSSATQQFTVTGTFADGTTADRTANASWTSSNTALLTISTTGLAKGQGSVTPGSVTVTATVGAHSANATVQVSKLAALTQLIVEPTSSSIAVGSAEQHAALALYADGTQQDVTSLVTWGIAPGTTTSTFSAKGGVHALASGLHANADSGSVATVDSTGTDWAMNPGMTQVQATYGTAQANSVVIVTPATVRSLAIHSISSLFPVGSNQALQLIGSFSDGTSQDLSLTANWQSSNPSVATVDAKGNATAVSAGPVVFTASFGGLTTQSEGYQVLSAALVSTTVQVDYPAVAIGRSENLHLIGNYADGSTHDLTSLATWASANSSVFSVDSTGLAYGISGGVTQVTGTVNGRSAITNVITINETLDSLDVLPTAPRLALGTTLPFQAIAHFSTGLQADITKPAVWTSAEPTVLTIDGNGVAKAGSVGTTTVTAALLGKTQISAPIEVTNATIVSLQLSAAQSQLAAGTGQQYTATGIFSDGTFQDISSDVVWDLTDDNVASINKDGLLSANLPGTEQIEASFGGQNASIPLTVTNATLLSTKLVPGNTEIPVTTRRTFKLIGTFSDATTQDLSYNTIFIAPTPSIVTLGPVGIGLGVSPGIGQITAQRGYYSASTPVTVTNAVLTGIALTPASATIRKGTQQQLVATGTYSDGFTVNLDPNSIFASTAPRVASVSNAGWVSGTGVGSAQISAAYKGITATTNGFTVLSNVLSSLDVTPANPSLLLGATQQLTATGTYTDGTTADVTAQTTWVSSNPLVVSISKSGVATALSLLGLSGKDGLTAFANPQSASVPVTATSGGQSKTFNVTVLPNTATLTSVTVTPASGSFAKGATQQFTLTGNYSDGTTQDLTSQATWTSSNAAVATISANGVATGAGVGAVQLTGTYNGKSSSTGTVNVTPATLSSIAVTPSSPSFAKGTTTQFMVIGTYSDGTTQDLTGSSAYASSNQGVVSVSAGGLATGVGTGSAQVTITSGGKSVTTGAVNVTAATLSSVAVSPTSASIAKGATQQFTLTGTFSDGTTQNLTGSASWGSSNASVGTITAGGLATGAGVGAVQFSGSYNGKTSSTGTVNVTPAALASIAVTPSSPSFAKGTTQQFMVTGTYTDGTTADLTGSSTYTSSNASVVSVSSSGLAMGTGTGSAQVTITSGGKTVTTGSVNVTPATVSSITVNPTSAHAAAGTTVQLTVTGTYTDGSTADVTSSASWTSSNPSTATVNVTGLVTGVSPGLASITATVGNLTNTGVVRVGAASLSSVAITPSGASFAAGATQKFTLTGTFTDGSTQDLSSSATWTTSDATVATIDANGLASGVAPGSVSFTASYNGMTATTPTVSVQPATLVSIAVTPSSPSFAKGTTTQFRVIGTYSDGSTRDLTGTATFASSDPSIVSISNGGLGQGLGTGSVQITVSAGGQTASTQSVTVTPATLSSVVITPSSPSLAAGTSQQFTATGTFSDGTTQDLSSQVVWTSSNPQVMTIGQLGLASTFQTGTVQVSATDVGMGITVSTPTIMVTPATLASISITPTTAQIAKGTVRQFTATGTYTDGTTQDVSSMVTWTSSNGSVVSINASGLATGTGIGSAVLTASLNGKSMSTNSFQVTPATLVSIAFNPAQPTVATGSNSQISVVGTFSDGSTQDLTSQAMYSSSNTAVATISSTGVIAGVAPGSSTITVSAMGVTNNFGVTVSNATLVSTAITPANPAPFAKGTTQQFKLVGTYSDGTTQDLSTTTTWTSSNPAVFTVDRNGLATGTGVGSGQLTSMYQGQTATTGSFQVTPATVSSLTITPGNASFAVGSTQQYTAMATYSDNTTADVSGSATWSSSNTGVVSINSTGFATGMGAGQAMVRAQYMGLSGAVNVTVTQAAATLQQIMVAPAGAASNGLHANARMASPNASVGATQQFSATAVYSDQSTVDVTTQSVWSSANTAIVTVNQSGLASLISGGTTSVQAQFGGLTGSAPVTVNAVAATLQSLAITPSAASVAKGLTQQFTATGTYSDGSTKDLTAMVAWTSSNTTFATINANGLAQSTTGGQTQIAASYQGQTAQVMLTVSAATLQSIALTPNSLNLANGTKQQIIATGTLSDGSTQDFTTSVNWSSSNTSNATVSASGVVSSLGVGPVTITAQAGGVNASLNVSVTAATPTSVQLTPTSVTVPVGGIQQFQATAMFTDGTSQNVTNSVTYTTSNANVVTVDANGNLHGVGTGTATVTATLGSASTTATISITQVALQALAITPANLSLADGLSQQLTATGTFADGSTQNLTNTVTWTSSNPQVATVSTTGKLTIIDPGTVMITATTDNISATNTVTATAAAVSAITVTPANTTLAAGQTQQYVATATLTDGSQQTVTFSANWSVSDPTKGSISNSGSTKGFLTTTAAGTLNVVATINGTSGQVPVTVQPAALTVLRITPNPIQTAAGTTQQLTVTGSYTDGSTANVTSTAVWTSGSASVATVDATGLLHAVMPGSTTVQAMVGSTTTTANVTVGSAVLNSIAITPTTTSLAKGLTQQLMATGTYTDGTTANVTSQVQWSSSAPSVATVSGTGLVSTLATGNSTLTAMLNGVSQTASVMVTAAVLQSIAVTASQNSFALGQTLQLVATGTYSDGTTQNLTNSATWTSSAPAVGMVTATGLASGRTTGTFTAQATVGGVSGSLPLTVTAAVLTSIAVTPANSIIVNTGNTQFTATGTFSDGTTQNLTNSVHWAVTGPVNVGTISQTGMLTGVHAGVAGTVTATLGTVVGSTGFTVVGLGL